MKDLTEIGHTKESAFALLDLAVPRSELVPGDMAGPASYQGYILQHGRGRFKVMGKTRFALEDALCNLLGIRIGVAEKLALEYAVSRGYATQVWETRNGKV